MSIKKCLLALLAMTVVAMSVSTPVLANDDAKTCHTDKDCGHGEHCKEGHCHK